MLGHFKILKFTTACFGLVWLVFKKNQIHVVIKPFYLLTFENYKLKSLLLMLIYMNM